LWFRQQLWLQLWKGPGAVATYLSMPVLISLLMNWLNSVQVCGSFSETTRLVRRRSHRMGRSGSRFALLVTFNVGGIPAEARPAAVGTFLLAWGIFTAYMIIAATSLSRPVLVVFILLTITFFVLAIGASSSQAGVTVLGGYLGLLTAIAAWYASAITVIASTRKR
jgi:GPR1/FUN34/yaaH family protein